VFSWGFCFLVLWQPCLEEVLFRGVLQGHLYQQSWGWRAWHGVTVANATTSLLFMLGHWWQHPPLWALAVLGPSCLFGYFRDRYASVYPSMALHAFYNAGYFVLTGLP
jgi:membrane protease YdiL (CAAX protease family)